MSGDEYFASAGSLKLKGVENSGIKKKKKKSKKDKDRKLEVFISREGIQDEDLSSKVDLPRIMKTDAERNFEERKRQLEERRLMKKASKSHKDNVAKFNKHLDGLSEFHDIPRTSWTS